MLVIKVQKWILFDQSVCKRTQNNGDVKIGQNLCQLKRSCADSSLSSVQKRKPIIQW